MTSEEIKAEQYRAIHNTTVDLTIANVTALYEIAFQLALMNERTTLDAKGETA